MQPSDLEAAVGRESAAVIMRTCGGSPIYVPLRVTGSKLAEMVGITAAQRLAVEYGGETVWIPIDPASRPREQVKELLRQGVEPREAQKQVGCSFMTLRAAQREIGE